jgi:hypothetical protein
VIDLIAQFWVGNLQLGDNLVNNGARPARALVIHAGKLALPPGVHIFFKYNDLGILSAQLDD